MSDYIRKLIEEGEHIRQDFKFEIADVRKIARTLVAFSNTEGGKLLIGVKDNGKISGIRSDEELYMIDSAAGLYCKPEIKYSVTKWVVEGKTVLEIDIPRGDEIPYLARSEDDKWLAYIRARDENFLVNAVQLRVWKNKKRNMGIFLPFTENEKKLFQFLQTNNSISIDEFCLLTGLTRKKASDILVRLITINELQILYSGEGIRYANR
ncbi:MAG: ATP-binding protein [Bacteroidales bacterium]|nr:ATP-binding protein [Bacteroidales bacterium]MCB9012639.1 ATP-binding protein [Bacteroidales bacterium]